MFNIVLFEPEIPQNTGNIGRSALAWNANLHLIEPIAFSIDDKHLKRAGLDYWRYLNVNIWKSFDDFVGDIPFEKLYFFSTKGTIRYDKTSYNIGDYFIFGPETRGLPSHILEKYRERVRTIPMKNQLVRSLNLSNCAAVVLFEALRQHNFGEK